MSAPGRTLQRLPIGPYPGLRPFQDHEAALLFGRERQSREVIERLGQRQFVAVLGGSGSGKSSLVLASVLPQLRSFGLPGAGDFWVALSCTPGTPAGADSSAQRLNTPLTRLARNFADLLRDAGSDEAQARRLADIAEVLRQDGGLARLLETYGDQLALPPGPDPSEARVLFVLDQFEEVFHPGNLALPDARALVERVIDHFYQPHPRGYLALTLRSEFLNECAAFLELPDAINSASYLVRRMDADELHQVIVGPAQRFLRLAARTQEEGLPALPEAVLFETGLIERILRDTQAITHDPDHLPLLQHLLARLWDAALNREGPAQRVPARLGLDDLRRAVLPGDGDVAPGPELNVLRACLEQQAEALYQRQAAPARSALDRVLARLGSTDPGSGRTSQQRLDVDAAAALLGPGQGRAELRALLVDSLLVPLGYLHWDDADPARVSIKVSHESFLRGWSRLRELVDREARRLEVLASVLRNCADWREHGGPDSLLLSGSELRRVEQSDLCEGLAQPDQRGLWLQALQGEREGSRLLGHADALDYYLALSIAREQQDRMTLRRRRSSLLIAAVATLAALPLTLYSGLIQSPVTLRAERIFAAVNEAQRVPLEGGLPGVGAGAEALATLLRAAELLEAARSGGDSPTARASVWLIERLGWLAPVQRQGRFLHGALAQSEPDINSRLRALLVGAVWSDPAGPTAGDLPKLATVTCRVAGDVLPPVPAQAVVAAGGARALTLQLQQGVIVPRGDAVVWRVAQVDVGSGGCLLGAHLVTLAADGLRMSLVDTELRYLALAEDSGREGPRLTLREIDWDSLQEPQARSLFSESRAVLTGYTLLPEAYLADGAAPLAPRVLPIQPRPGGHALALQGELWRLVSPWAQSLSEAARADFDALPPAASDSPCRAPPQPGTPPQAGEAWLDTGLHCIALATAPAASGLQPLQVRLFERPLGGGVGDAPPLAHLGRFARVLPEPQAWFWGRRGAHAGWLALQRQAAPGTAAWVGAPLSTCALWRLGREIQLANPAPGDAEARARLELPAEPPPNLCADR